MKILIQSDGIVLTQAIKTSAEEKFGRLRRLLQRFDHSDLIFNVMFSRTTNHSHKGKIFRAECRLKLGKKQVFAATEGSELYETIDLTAAAIKKQCVKLKELQTG